MASVLGTHKLVAFVPITDPERAKAFYRDMLGLPLIEEQLPFALVFDANGIMLRATPMKQVVPASFTILGWETTDIFATAQALAAAGVKFERYPNMGQDELGIWSAPGAAKVAWFKDPDGNILSISQHGTL